MARLGAQSAHRICGPLLDTICKTSTQPCALVDPAGYVVSASTLFAAVADREPRLAAFLVEASNRAASEGEAWVDDGWIVGRASLLNGSILSVVQLFGPAVVRARLALTYRQSLSGREAECLALALEGSENGEVATRLGVKSETVKVHLRNAYRKLAVGGRAEILAKLVSSP